LTKAKEGLTYKDAGVDIEAGNRLVKNIANIFYKTISGLNINSGIFIGQTFFCFSQNIFLTSNMLISNNWVYNCN